MAIKIITDSVSDIPSGIAESQGITVIPLNVHFGGETFRDGIDQTAEEFYARLEEGKAFPTTTVPPVSVYTDTYDMLAQDADGIVVIAFSRKLGAGYDIALEARGMMKRPCRVEVIDSQRAGMAQGLLAIAAARATRAGTGMDELVAKVRKNITRTDIRMVFDTLEYMKRGGRIGKAQVFLSSVLKVNPILGIKDGEVYPFAREHSRARAIDYLYKFAAGYHHVDSIAVEDATTPQEADKLAQRLATRFPDANILRAKVGAVAGAHTGPHVLGVAVLGDRAESDT